MPRQETRRSQWKIPGTASLRAYIINSLNLQDLVQLMAIFTLQWLRIPLTRWRKSLRTPRIRLWWIGGKRVKWLQTLSLLNSRAQQRDHLAETSPFSANKRAHNSLYKHQDLFRAGIPWAAVTTSPESYRRQIKILSKFFTSKARQMAPTGLPRC